MAKQGMNDPKLRLHNDFGFDEDREAFMIKAMFLEERYLEYYQVFQQDSSNPRLAFEEFAELFMRTEMMHLREQ